MATQREPTHLETAALDAAQRSVPERSRFGTPGLDQFRTSPFRILRLSPSATARQAVWQCDKALACVRIGVPLAEPDLVPWLPEGDEIDIQTAVQAIESPVLRIVEQLLWFDVADDDDGAALRDGLIAGDEAKLREYLERPGAGSVSHRINDANLRLLLGFSLLHGIGPMASSASVTESGPQVAKWTRNERADDPHVVVRRRATERRNRVAWASLLRQGVARWSELSTGDDFAEHARARMAALDDELLTEDAFEIVVSGLRTRIADLIAGEIRSELVRGRSDSVAQLLEVAGACKLDPEIWQAAFRPLKAQFQAELADLAPDAQTGLGVIEDVDIYLERVRALSERWRALDGAQLLGLSTLLDEAVRDAFARLRTAPSRMQVCARFDAVLTRVGEVAQSGSLKQRVESYRERLVSSPTGICHFCRRREAEISYCAAVSSKQETRREPIANGVRIYYRVGIRPIPRCRRCALIHGFLRQVQVVVHGALLVLLAIVGVWIGLHT